MNVYRVGLVGLSGIAAAPPREPVDPALPVQAPGSHAAAYALHPQTEVVAVCDIAPAALQLFSGNWGSAWPEVYQHTDYREMLKNQKLDILSVATPDNLHADIVVAAAQAGVRAIFCEKPLATSLEDADRMLAAVEAAGIPMVIDHTRRWYPLYHRVQRLIRDGAIGTLSRIVAHLGGSRAMLFRNGTHMIDVACFFAEADAAWVWSELDPGYEDYGPAYAGDGGRDSSSDPGASAYIHFSNGVRAFYIGSKSTPARFEWELIGERGYIRVNDAGAQLNVLSAQGQMLQRFITPEPTMHYGILGGVAETVRLLEGSGSNSSSPREARKVIAILLGILQSQAQDNRKVWLLPESSPA